MRYSNSKEIQEEVEKLISDGWTFKWGGKHGKIYSPDGKMRMAVPGTPSDRRAALNWMRDVNRLKRGQKIGVRDMEYVAKPMTPVEGFKNTARIVPAEEAKPGAGSAGPMPNPIVQSLVDTVAEKTPFNNDAFDLAKDLIEKAYKNYHETAVILDSKGFVSPEGHPLKSHNLSELMRRRGFRLRSFRRDKKHFKPVERPSAKKIEKSQAERSPGLKRFDSLAFETAKGLLNGGFTFREVAGLLSREGYGSRSGHVLNEHRLRVTMYQKGYLIRDQAVKSSAPPSEVKADTKKQKAPAPVEQQSPPKMRLLTDVMELVSSNLSDAFKERHLIMLAREWQQEGLLK